MTPEIISAGVGGFVAWVLTKSASYLILRHRLSCYLIVSLNVSFHGDRENLRWLRKVVEQQLNPGTIVTGAPFYEKDDLSSLTSTRDRALQLLTKRELILVEKAIQALWEIEVLFGGFCRTLCEMQDRGQPLDTAATHLLRMRASRLATLIEILPERIRTMRDLPEDYAGKIGPDVLVPPSDRLSPTSGHVASM